MVEMDESLHRLDWWIMKEEWRGWDPFDALNSPIIKFLVFGKRRLGQAGILLLKHAPLNLRSLLKVPKVYNSKSMGLFLSAYALQIPQVGEVEVKSRAEFCARWLGENVSRKTHGAAWGYPFDWPNRGFYAPAGTPTGVNSALIGLSFLDYAVALRSLGLNYEIPLQISRSVCEFLLRDLNRLEENGHICFSYTPIDHRFIHNANLLPARLLAEVFAWTGEAYLAQTALVAGRFSVARQNPDGSWLYGIDPMDAWIDNFHTAYNLIALKAVAARINTQEFDQPIYLGYRYWKENFFLANGTPKYYNNRIYPIDTHCAAVAILTFLDFRDIDPQALDLARHIANWTVENMQDPKGFFYYQKTRWYTNKIAYMRWTQAWMLLALTQLSLALGETF